MALAFTHLRQAPTIPARHLDLRTLTFCAVPGGNRSHRYLHCLQCLISRVTGHLAYQDSTCPMSAFVSNAAILLIARTGGCTREQVTAQVHSFTVSSHQFQCGLK
jgi:hypothetical protein